jgi:general secretion pathway protein D
MCYVDGGNWRFSAVTRAGRAIGCAAAACILIGCAQMTPPVPGPSESHLKAPPETQAPIPEVVTQVPYVPPPALAAPVETYTVVVNDLPVRELLFALARDAELNVDLHAGVQGTVTLNAVDQTLPQVLDRIARQVDMRYSIENGTILVEPDTPYLRNYRVDYVNITRDSDLEMQVATQIESAVEGGAAPGAGANNSRTNIRSVSNNRFWRTLTRNVLAMLGETAEGGSDTEPPPSDRVIANPEAGVLSVRASSRQHAEIQAFLDQVVLNAQRQVLIEATIVEVELDDKYQAGIDWGMVREQGDTGLGSTLDLVGPPPTGGVTTFTLDYVNPDSAGLNISATISLLEQFGDTHVLSSPRIMALNNQTAVLKVAENRVYFTIQGDISQNQTSQLATFTSTPHTVPVGFVMNVTPQINENSVVLLNVRPTISRIVGFVQDPNPVLQQVEGEPVISQIPEIAVRELESILKIHDGQVAVLGGLMQDSIIQNRNGVPFLNRLPLIGDAVFTSRSHDVVKTELVVFLRPVIVRNPSLSGDFRDFRPLLERNSGGH